jgi:hypothetical protein
MAKNMSATIVRDSLFSFFLSLANWLKGISKWLKKNAIFWFSSHYIFTLLLLFFARFLYWVLG